MIGKRVARVRGGSAGQGRELRVVWDRQIRVRGQGVAVDQDILVTGTTAFSRDDVHIVGFGDFVDYADKTLVPAVFVVRGFLGGWIGGRGVARSDVAETWLCIGDPGQVEGQGERGDDDVDL